MKKYITIIFNEEGYNEYNYWKEIRNNCKEIEIPRHEVTYLFEKGVFDKINEKCDLFIDDAESEIIYHEKINECIKLLAPHKEIIPVIYEAFMEIKDNGYAIALDF